MAEFYRSFGSNIRPASKASDDPARVLWENEFFGVTAPPGGTGLIKVYLSGEWVEKPVKAYLSGAWVEKPLRRWSGSSWV